MGPWEMICFPRSFYCMTGMPLICGESPRGAFCREPHSNLQDSVSRGTGEKKQ